MKVSISLKNVWKKYGKNGWAIKNINFDIEKGEIVALLGHNGAGKTTIMKCIMNLIFPQKGSIKIFDIENSKKDAKKYLGYLPEYFYLPKYYKVIEIFNIGIHLKNLNKEETEKEVKKYINLLGLQNFVNKEISYLSKGNLQKVAIIFSLIGNPEIILWDEPTQNLDPITRIKLRDIIIEHKTMGKTFLISSHLLTEVENICDRVILIKNGKIFHNLRIEEINKKWKTLENFYISSHREEYESHKR